MRATDLMTRNVASVSPDHNIRHAIALMLERQVSGLPVIDNDGHLVGMLTEGDLMRRVGAGPAQPDRHQSPENYVRSHSWRVGDVMSTDIVSVDPSCPAARMADLMANRGIKRLPVIDNGRLAGIVSRADLLAVLLGQEAEKVAAGDRALETAIRSRLIHELGLKDIDVVVNDGKVTLTGTVPASPAIRAAMLVAENLAGVTAIVNKLAIGAGDS